MSGSQPIRKLAAWGRSCALSAAGGPNPRGQPRSADFLVLVLVVVLVIGNGKIRRRERTCHEKRRRDRDRPLSPGPQGGPWLPWNRRIASPRSRPWEWQPGRSLDGRSRRQFVLPQLILGIGTIMLWTISSGGCSQSGMDARNSFCQARASAPAGSGRPARDG